MKAQVFLTPDDVDAAILAYVNEKYETHGKTFTECIVGQECAESDGRYLNEYMGIVAIAGMTPIDQHHADQTCNQDTVT